MTEHTKKQKEFDLLHWVEELVILILVLAGIGMGLAHIFLSSKEQEALTEQWEMSCSSIESASNSPYSGPGSPVFVVSCFQIGLFFVLGCLYIALHQIVLKKARKGETYESIPTRQPETLEMRETVISEQGREPVDD